MFVYNASMNTTLVLCLIINSIIFILYSIGTILVLRRQRFYPLQKRPISLILLEFLCGILFSVVQILLDFEILPCNFRELWYISVMSILSLTLMAGSYHSFVKFKFTSDSVQYLSKQNQKYSFDNLSQKSFALRHMKRFTNAFFVKVVLIYTLLFVFVVALLSYKISPGLWKHWGKRDNCSNLTITNVALSWLEAQFLVFDCILAYFYHRELKNVPDGSKLKQELAIGLSLWTLAIFSWIVISELKYTTASHYSFYVSWILYFILVRLPLIWATYSPENAPEHSPSFENIPINFDLTQVLRKNSVIKEKYKEFLQGEFAIENILFWEEIELFRNVPEYLRDIERKKVWDLYFLPSSPLEINISDYVRTDAFSKMNSPFGDTFDAVQREVSITMQSDSFMRFMRTPLFQRLPSKERILS